jgi:hypothetical protein
MQRLEETLRAYEASWSRLDGHAAASFYYEPAMRVTSGRPLVRDPTGRRRTARAQKSYGTSRQDRSLSGTLWSRRGGWIRLQGEDGLLNMRGPVEIEFSRPER